MAAEELLEALKREIGDTGGMTAKVVAVLGTGVTAAASGRAATASWRGLLEHGLDYCVRLGRATEKWRSRRVEDLEEGDTSDWIAVASQIEQRLGAPKSGDFRNWLKQAIGGLTLEDPGLIDAIAALNRELMRASVSS